MAKIDAGDWAMLVLFLLIMGLIIYTVIQKPSFFWEWKKGEPKKKYRIHYSMIPLSFVLLLWACTLIPTSSMKFGIIGDSAIFPYRVVITFMSVAYICIAFDQSGILSYLSYKVVLKAQKSYHLLFFAIYIMSSLLALFTSNDVVILTMTQVIFYITSTLKISPKPYIFAEFFAANTWSSSLLVGNATNIIVAQAFQVSFLEFSKYTLMPTFVTSIASCLLLYLYFRNTLIEDTKNKSTNNNSALMIDPEKALTSPTNALIGTIVLICYLVFLACAKVINLPLWIVCIGAASGYFTILLIVDFFDIKIIEKRGTSGKAEKVFKHPPNLDAISSMDTMQSLATLSTASNESKGEILNLQDLQIEMQRQDNDQSANPTNDNVILQKLEEGIALQVQMKDSEVKGDVEPKKEAENSKESSREPETSRSSLLFKGKDIKKNCAIVPLLSLPWRVIPFVIPMFILVDALSYHGWIDILATALSDLSQNNIALCVLVYFIAGLIICNIINNQPMAILMTKTLLSEKTRLNDKSLRAAMFAVILASNYGALFTLIGALAGILWVKILKTKQVFVSYLEFARVGLFVMIPAVALAGIVLAIEVFNY